MAAHPSTKARRERWRREGKCLECGRNPVAFRVVKGESVATTRCAVCTEASRVKRSTEEYKKKRREYCQSDAGKTRQFRANHSAAGVERKKRFKASDKGKIAMYKLNHSDAMKKGKKKYKQKLKADRGRWVYEIMQTTLRRMVQGLAPSSVKILKATGVDASAFKAHLQSTWPEDGIMSWSNYGFGNDKWNIGHRIPKSMYDANNSEDMKKCWSLKNLFAQNHQENKYAGVKLMGYRELVKLQDIFPSSWGGELPTADQIVAYETNAQGHKVVDVPSGRMSPSIAFRGDWE